MTVFLILVISMLCVRTLQDHFPVLALMDSLEMALLVQVKQLIFSNSYIPSARGVFDLNQILPKREVYNYFMSHP